MIFVWSVKLLQGACFSLGRDTFTASGLKPTYFMIGDLPWKVLHTLIQEGNVICLIQIQSLALDHFLSQLGEPGIIHRASLVLKGDESLSDLWTKCLKALSTVTALISWESVMVQMLHRMKVTNCPGLPRTQGFLGWNKLVTLMVIQASWCTAVVRGPQPPSLQIGESKLEWEFTWFAPNPHSL